MFRRLFPINNFYGKCLVSICYIFYNNKVFKCTIKSSEIFIWKYSKHLHSLSQSTLYLFTIMFYDFHIIDRPNMDDSEKCQLIYQSLKVRFVSLIINNKRNGEKI